MSDKSTEKQSTLVEFSQAIGAILGVPLVLFALVNNMAQQTAISLVVAVLTGIALTVWLFYVRKMNWTYLAIAWLILIVIGLVWFAVWPNTMTIEGFVSDTNGEPVMNETVKFFDYRGQVYETQTDKDGFYQFVDVPTGKYRIKVRNTEIQGESKGLLVRVVSQSIAVSPESEEIVNVVPTDTPTPEKPEDDVPIDDVTDTPTPEPTSTFTSTPKPSDPPTPTNTPVPTPTIDADPMYDDFNNPAYNGKFNNELWEYNRDNTDGTKTIFNQQDGILEVSREAEGIGTITTISPRSWTIGQIGFIEAKMMLDSNIKALDGGNVHTVFSGNINGSDWYSVIYIGGGQGNSDALIGFDTADYNGESVPSVAYNSWHTVRFEINPETAVISAFVDGKKLDETVHSNPEAFKQSDFKIAIGVYSYGGGLVTGYIDDVRIGTIE